MKVAIFDFDGTIYKYETYSLMLDMAKQDPRFQDTFKRFYYSIVPPYLGYKIRLYPEAKMKYDLTQKYLRLLHGMTPAEVEAYFKEIATKMEDDLNELVLERMEQHHDNNDLIMVVSGAFTPLLQAVLKEFPVDHIIGTDIPFARDQVDSTIPIDHVQAERKTELILETLKNNVIDWKNSYAYGDTMADIPVLEMVGNPVVVCPEAKLQTLANKQKWPTIC